MGGVAFEQYTEKIYAKNIHYVIICEPLIPARKLTIPIPFMLKYIIPLMYCTQKYIAICYATPASLYTSCTINPVC